MGGFRKTMKKYDPSTRLAVRALGNKTYDKLSFLGTSLEKKEAAADRAAALAEDEANKPAIPMADEEELARIQRRRNARRGGGRASTVLSDEDRLGP